jgi:hypothetical protein
MPSELENYCKVVYYYARKTTLFNLFKKRPYIVESRQDGALLHNLLQNDYPILFEGLHTTCLLAHEKLQHRKKIVRLHNIEWMYYKQLFDMASNTVEKIYFYSEYKKLLKYEQVLANTQIISCLSFSDNEYYQDKFPHIETKYIPVFHQHNEIQTISGKGKYILFHGNLSIPDNYLPLIKLLKNELHDTDYKIIAAGKNPTKYLTATIAKYNYVELITNPTQERMNQLIQQAHINIVFSEIHTGIKLKLINSLFLGRFCFANEHAVAGTQLEHAVVMINYKNIKERIVDYMEKDFTQTMIDERKQMLSSFNNLKNAEMLQQIF